MIQRNSQQASAPRSQSLAEVASHTPTPWREWDVMTSAGKDEYPEPHVGDIRLVGANNICIGVVFGGYASLPECEANAAFIVKATTAHDALVSSLQEMIGIYWGEGDGIEPPPECIQRAQAALTKANL